MGFKVTLTQIKTAIETGFSLQIWDLKDQNPVYFVVWLDVLASKYGI